MTQFAHAEQHERAFQKQQGVFQGNEQTKAKKGKKGLRYVKKVGLGFATPDEAKFGHYVDKKCPFTSKVAIRGRLFKGMVISSGKMKNTIVLRKHYLHYVKKFNRFEKRHKNVPVHCSPAFDITDGDIVTAGQCRPLSKTVRFNVLKVTPNHVFGNARKQFRL